MVLPLFAARVRDAFAKSLSQNRFHLHAKASSNQEASLKSEYYSPLKWFVPLFISPWPGVRLYCVANDKFYMIPSDIAGAAVAGTCQENAFQASGRAVPRLRRARVD